MEKAEFEKRFLDLVHRSDMVLTAPSVAHQLEIGIEEAQEHLLSLELNGTLEQATDERGATYYVMPNRPAPGTGRALPTSGEGNRGTPGMTNPADLPSAPIYSGPGTAPAKGRSINGLVLNVIFPGVGSLVCGRGSGFAMLALVLLGIILLFALSGWSKLLGIVPIVVAWIWSIVAGVGLLDDREPPPGTPR